MRRRWAVAAAAVGLAALSLGTPSASATTATTRQCVETDTYTFNPPLRVGTQTGTVTVNASLACVRETAQTAPPGESVWEEHATATGFYSYTGNCALALMTGGSAVHAIVGGTLVVHANTASTWAEGKVIALVPNNPCTDAAGQSSGTGVGPKFDAAAF